MAKKQFLWMDEEAFSLSISFYTAVITGLLGWFTARHFTRG